jgi:hypothetical protein
VVPPAAAVADETSFAELQRKRVSQQRPLHIQDSQPNISEAIVRGPQFHAPETFHGFEQSTSPQIRRLRDEYQLDDVVRGETDEFRQMLKLRHWVHSRWPIDNEQKLSGDVFQILEYAKAGHGFYCTHSMRVQHAVMTAMGFIARDLGVDCDHQEFGRSIHHGVNDVWSNQYAKWVVLDAKYDVHYELEGVPLSARELHEAARADGGKKVVKVQGVDRAPVPMKGLEYPTSSVLTYWWVSYYLPLNTFTGQTRDNRLVIFDNSAFRDTKWYRGGANSLKEHWAYAAKTFVPTRDRNSIDWTPGVPELQARQVSPAELEVTFHSVTPNLKDYEVRVAGGPWQSAVDRYRWALQSGTNTLEVRTRNSFGVNGPAMTASVRLAPAASAAPGADERARH